MSAGASRAGAPAATNPWLIAAVVALATFMEVLDTTIANVALPYIAGGLGVSEDEASWVVTTYLVSNAIALTASSFLARWLGRKSFFLICLALFTVSSLLCGLAPSLSALIFFRILQGLGGGGMPTSEQAILADTFPPHKRGQAFALYGVAVIVVDAGAVVDGLANASDAGPLRRLLADEDLHAPALLDYEVVSVVRGLTTGGRLSRHRAEDLLADFDDLPIERWPCVDSLRRRAWSNGARKWWDPGWPADMIFARPNSRSWFALLPVR